MEMVSYALMELMAKISVEWLGSWQHSPAFPWFEENNLEEVLWVF